MLHKHWNNVIALVIIFKLVLAFNCSDQSVCVLKPENNKTFTEQVLEIGKHYSNMSFTILVCAGNYTTLGRLVNFINFTNVTIKKHPDNTMPVNIMCPEFSNTIHNGVGFEHSMDIEVSGLNFMKCGSITSGLYFRYTKNINVSDSSFHHNSDNGIQIVYGSNIIITGCNFSSNIGLQPDSISDLIKSDTFTRGAGIGLVFEDQRNISTKIIGCNFENNVAYKNVEYNSLAETRPYDSIPLGNGGGIYINLHGVKNSYTAVTHCNFYNNTAIHQGGAIVMLPVNSTGNVLNISGCTFIGNKVLGYFLRDLSDTIEESTHSIDEFISKINARFSLENFNVESALDNLTFSNLSSSGGSGGAIAVSLFESVDNVLLVSNSHFTENLAFSAGAIRFVVSYDLLANNENSIDSNQAFIHKYAIKC